MTSLKFLKEPKTVNVIAVDFSGGQPKPGVDQGPLHLIEFGLIDQLKGLNWTVEFNGRFPNYAFLKPEQDLPEGKIKQPLYVSRVSEAVKNTSEVYLKRGHLSLMLGGDHSLALGTVAATMSAYPNACVIWIDAHADINTAESTLSGNLHGCPLAFLLGLTELPQFSWLKPCLSPDRLVYIGLRDVDPPEKEILIKNKIKAFSMHDVDRYGIGKVVEMALDYVNPNRTRPIHLSFDVDAMDPSVAPATGTPVRGGLTFREGHYICEAIWETGCVVAVDMVEVNPTLVNEDELYQTVTVGCSLIRCSLGETLL